MAINGHVRNAEPMQYFPQPSMPDSAYTMQDYRYVEGEDERNDQVNDHILSALWETLEEIDIKGKELFKKIFSKGDIAEIPLGRLAREAIGDTRAMDLLEAIKAKVGKIMMMKAYQKDDMDFVVGERGVSIDQELTEKLERFKVKTVNINGGVVKDDKK